MTDGDSYVEGEPELAAAQPGWGAWQTGTCVLLGLLTILVYAKVTGNGFLFWDDDVAITRNEHFRGLTLDHLRWMFTDTSVTLRYEAMTWLVWGAIYSVCGLSAVAFHTLNLAMHAVNVILVYMLIRTLLPRVMGGQDKPRVVDGCAALGAAIWGMHPLRVEVVAWATQACFAESACFSLLTVLFYIRAVDANRERPAGSRWFWAAFGCFGISSLFFASGVGVAAILPLLDLLLLRRPAAEQAPMKMLLRYAAEKWMFLLVAVVIGLVTIHGRMQTAGAWYEMDQQRLTALECVMQAAYIVTYYVWKPFDVFHISPVYTMLVSFNPLSAVFIGSLIFAGALTVAAVLLRRRYPCLSLLWLAHLLLIFPFGGYFDHPHFSSDRYSYLDGILWGIVAGAAVLWGWRSAVRSNRLLAAGAAGALLLGCTAATVSQLPVWRSSEALFSHILAGLDKDPFAAEIHCRLGVVRVEQGRFADAVAESEAALALRPDHPKALRLRFTSLTQLGDHAALAHLGDLSLASHAPFEEAATYYLGAASIIAPNADKDKTPSSVQMLAALYTKARRLADAERVLREGMARFPDHGDLYLRLAQVRYLEGHPSEGRELMRRSLELNPSLQAAADRVAAYWKTLPAVPDQPATTQR